MEPCEAPWVLDHTLVEAGPVAGGQRLDPTEPVEQRRVGQRLADVAVPVRAVCAGMRDRPALIAPGPDPLRTPLPRIEQRGRDQASSEGGHVSVHRESAAHAGSGTTTVTALV